MTDQTTTKQSNAFGNNVAEQIGKLRAELATAREELAEKDAEIERLTTALDQLRDAHHTPYADDEHQGGNCVDMLMAQSAENARLTAKLADTRERVVSLQGLHSTSQETARKARAELATTREELARWRSGRRQRALPVIESVPDGLQYAAYLARAQGTEGGEEHDTLLRNASMRMKALNDVARQLLAEREARFGYARKHLHENEGWSCTADGDFCPDCDRPASSVRDTAEPSFHGLPEDKTPGIPA